MELSDVLAVGTPIYFHVLHTNLVGMASVHYCTHTGAKYFIGVEFGTVSW